MTRRILSAGKLPPALLREVLDSGRPTPPELRLPPAVGEDAGVIAVEGGALVIASDPVTFTGSGLAGVCVTVNANDVAVTGARPRWFLSTILLPPGTDEAFVQALFRELHDALAAIGATLVGGHTEVTPAVNHPVISGQMLGFAPDGRFLRTGGVRPGDIVLQIGPAPIEGAAVLASDAAIHHTGLAPDALAPEVLAAARQAVTDPGISVVEPALAAAAAGAHALHDPTEGGLATGLHEMAEASSVGLTVDAGAVLWFAPGRAICAALGADPWGTLASGALLAAFAADTVGQASRRLIEAGYTSAAIATAHEGGGVMLGDGSPLARFDADEVARLLR